MMNTEVVFRIIFVLFSIVMMLIRGYSQKVILPERGRTAIKGSPLSLVLGAIAAITAIVFGLEYMIAPGTFRFAYPVTYPIPLRWLGSILLGTGLLLLGAAHYHLGLSFSSFVAIKEGQQFVNTGPYRSIRHPIYTAYAVNYLGGGLLAGNIILTVVPIVCFGLMIAFRIGEEEAMLIEEFGERYRVYMTKTGRFLPFL